jgi:hypothetical protein
VPERWFAHGDGLIRSPTTAALDMWWTLTLLLSFAMITTTESYSGEVFRQLSN